MNKYTYIWVAVLLSFVVVLLLSWPLVVVIRLYSAAKIGSSRENAVVGSGLTLSQTTADGNTNVYRTSRSDWVFKADLEICVDEKIKVVTSKTVMMFIFGYEFYSR